MRLHYPRANHRNKGIAQLARRWAWRKRHGAMHGYKVGIRRVLRKHPIHASRWPWSGRRGSVDFLRGGHVVASNPRRHRSRGYAIRFNPSVKALGREYTASLTGVGKNVGRVFKGKGMLMNTGVAIGGAAIALAGGSMIQRWTMPLLVKIPGAAGFAAGAIGSRVVGAVHASLASFIAAKALPIGADKKNAILAGGAVAAITELIFPGRASAMLAKLPVVGSMLAPHTTSPVQGVLAGLYGYVDAPGYQGVGEYVDAPGYQGVGADQLAADQLAADDAVAGYVEAPGYQGVGNLGMAMGSKMPSFLDG